MENRSLSDAEVARLGATALLCVMAAISLAGIGFWLFGNSGGHVAAAGRYVSIWMYPTVAFLLSTYLAFFRGVGFTALFLSAAVFVGVAINMKGLVVYPGTFESWMIRSDLSNRHILGSVGVGSVVGLVASHYIGTRVSRWVLKQGALWMIWGLVTACSIVYSYLALFKGDPFSAFSPNQPLGVAVTWLGATVSIVVGSWLGAQEPDSSARVSGRSPGRRVDL